MTWLMIFSLLAGAGGLLAAGYFFWWMKRHSQGTAKMQEISHVIQKGAMAFISREYKVLTFFMLLMALILGLAIHLYTAFAFLFGATCSATAGYIAMRGATHANVRTANAAKESFSRALRIAFAGGAVLGMTVVGLGLAGLIVAYYILTLIFPASDMPVKIVAGFGFGASSVALFARVGGGIFTKAADVGADLVGKVESNIPEDDPRNPAVIADNVGDNVGDIAGMGSDLLESYVASLISAMTVGWLVYGSIGVILPVAIGGAGILSGIIGAAFVKPAEVKGADFQQQTQKARSALNRGTFVTIGLTAVGTYFLVAYTIGQIGIFISVLCGLAAGLLIGLITEHYTSDKEAAVQNIAHASVRGAAPNIISGLSIGLASAALSAVLVCVAVYLAYYFGGLYGVPMAAVGLLAILSIILSIDGYGPITDNAAGIAEMAGMGTETRKRAEALDSVGNTTAAINKGFAACSAVFTAFALVSAYAQVAGFKYVNLTHPPVLIGVLIGGMMPFLFSSLLINAVGKAAMKMVNEVRRQFREITGLMEGTSKPNYTRCIDISTRAALKEMILPSTLAVTVPLFLGLILGAEAVGGLLTGSIIIGSMLAILMANSGGAWDNAKKFIEAGNLGGKGTFSHKNAVIGDTVGDPFKDTAGPSIDILIKVMSIVSLIFVGLFI
ncbi:MAG: sodium-translocating pyrophosphatase [Candidatus Aminicenantes bacterium]|nr:sodium-translocating pyrophosphatase [Candidatus Aminicenantes bacterium]